MLCLRAGDEDHPFALGCCDSALTIGFLILVLASVPTPIYDFLLVMLTSVPTPYNYDSRDSRLVRLPLIHIANVTTS